MGKMFSILRAMNDLERAMMPRCDWCGQRSDALTIKPTIDGSHGDGNGTHSLCRRCVTRYNEEAREYAHARKAN